LIVIWARGRKPIEGYLHLQFNLSVRRAEAQFHAAMYRFKTGYFFSLAFIASLVFY
jgi:hypothetical protein